MRIVVCAMARNEHKYINEWVNHYVNLGFDKIYLYDNDELDSPYIGDFIENKKKVEIINIRGMKKECLQHEIYTQFYNSHDFDWCLFCDIDEFLVGVKNIHYMLEHPMYRRAYQIRIKWRLFGDDDMITRDMSIPVIKAFTKEVKSSLCRDLVTVGNLERQAKSIIRGHLGNVIIDSPHFGSFRRRDNVIPSILPSGKPCWAKVAIKDDYSRETIYLNHYMTKTLSEFVKQKLNRNDAVFNKSLQLDYFWRINKQTPEKLEWLRERGYIE